VKAGSVIVSRIEPNVGPNSGGTRVTITGSGFVAGESECKVNNQYLTTILENNQLKCTLPALTGTNVSVTVNGEGATNFILYGPHACMVKATSPSRAKAVGGASSGEKITMELTHAATDVLRTAGLSTGSVMCWFDTAEFAVVPDLALLKSGVIQCVPPTHGPGSILPTVTFNGQHNLSSNAAFTYVCEPSEFIETATKTCQACASNTRP
jgi:hypothetical protein